MKRWIAAAAACIVAPCIAQASFAPNRPVLDVQDIAVLERLEADGFSLGAVLARPGARSTRALRAESAVMRRLAEEVAADVAELRAEVIASGRALDESRPGEAGGALDAAWLDSAIAHFELAAIVNRLDRRDFSAAEGRATCGEVRLIYRLAYETRRRDGAPTRSRLPFLLNAVFDVAQPAGGDCLDAALAWVPRSALADPVEAARFLAQGPLRGGLMLRQIEINAQVLRFPSGVEPAFGGQAAYLLRVFRIEAGEGGPTAIVGRLENTPDVERLRSDPALRAELIAYLRANAGAIDRGVYAMPERFAATKAIAYSTFGSARLGNHPFSRLLGPGDFAAIDFKDMTFARSAEALIERLDNGTCQGCHQAGATAGFHLLGRDRAGASPMNRLAQSDSPHFVAERARRDAYATALIAGQEPATFRPHSLTPAADWSGARPFFASAGTAMACPSERARALMGEAWSCAPSETCEVIAENERLPVAFGQCMPKRETSGLACMAGRVTTGATPVLDRLEKLTKINSFAARASASVYQCRPPKIGVPGGLAYRQCDPADRAFEGFASSDPGALPAEICGLAGGKTFDRCIASKDVAGCLEQAVSRGNRPTCSRDRHCREDYICQALPDGLEHRGRVPEGVGFCSPTYFVMQMRHDGHPDPRGVPAH